MLIWVMLQNNYLVTKIQKSTQHCFNNGNNVLMDNPNEEWRDADPININVTDENKTNLSSQSFTTKKRIKR